MDFKQRVQNSIIAGAIIYKSVFLDFEYLIYSPGFVENPYYIISANEDNYLHLTGVHALMSARDFYTECYKGTIKESDFDFIRGSKSEKSIKGSVREKILALPLMAVLFSNKLQAEENFTKGNVHCAIATADNQITVGFVNAKNAVPKSLLRRNQLNHAKSVVVSLVLRRNKGSDKFNAVLQSDVSRFYIDYPGIIDSKVELIQ
jgi:hypothetical protein